VPMAMISAEGMSKLYAKSTEWIGKCEIYDVLPVPVDPNLRRVRRAIVEKTCLLQIKYHGL
jgi:hypothetical protein